MHDMTLFRNSTFVTPERLSLDELYHSQEVKVDLTTIDMDMIDVMTIKSLQNNVVSITPQCLCGALNEAIYMDEICPSCHTPVVNSLGSYTSLVWISTPDGSKKFISPQFWGMLNRTIKECAFDSLAYLSNPRYRSNLMVPKILDAMIKDIPGFKRTYSYLVENMEVILTYLINTNITTFYTKRDKFRAILELYRTKKDSILSAHIPLPSSDLFLVEDTTFSNKKLNLVTGQLKSLTLNYKDNIEAGKDLDSTISRLISELAIVYDMNGTDLIDGKKRTVRTNIFGTKAPGSFRTVMVAISGPHMYDEFIMPWVEGVINFRPYLISILQDRGYRYMDASVKLDNALLQYDKVIADIMDEIIEDAKRVNGKGVSIIMNRNPTQHRFSLINVFISKIKKDPLDFASEYSAMLCAALNGD